MKLKFLLSSLIIFSASFAIFGFDCPYGIDAFPADISLFQEPEASEWVILHDAMPVGLSYLQGWAKVSPDAKEEKIVERIQVINQELIRKFQLA